jgi:hypothetical protein
MNSFAMDNDDVKRRIDRCDVEMSQPLHHRRYDAASDSNCPDPDDSDIGNSHWNRSNLTANIDDRPHKSMNNNNTNDNGNIKATSFTQKYTKEYIENRIVTLRQKLQNSIPGGDSLELNRVFVSILRSFETAKQSLEGAIKLLQDLQQTQTNGTIIDPKILELAQDAVEKAQSTVTDIRRAVTDAGCAVVSANTLDDLPHSINEVELLECTVLVQGTPMGLSEWCKRGHIVKDAPYGKSLGTTNEVLLDTFLKDVILMKEVLIANGPSRGHYGPMLEIHSRLRQEMAQAEVVAHTAANPGKDSENRHGEFWTLQDRLALAVALEHATPILVFQTTGVYVDPVERFWHYLNAYQKGELDGAFATMSTWELRLVVDCNAMDRDIQWGRDYLKSYRPDQIWTREDDRFRYIWSVRTDLGYRQPDHEFSNYVDLISAGGECGARAWFARFICKSFGIPTWGVRQPGHAAVSRWLRTSVGCVGNSGEAVRVKWTTCLGVGWDLSTWDENRYTGPAGNATRHGLDFFEETQARNFAAAASCSCKSYYLLVTLLECLAESYGETVEEDYSSEKIWRSLSIAQRKMLAQSQDSLDPIELEENNERMSEFEVSRSAEEPNEAGTNLYLDLASIQTDGRCIVIPAASFVDPPNPTNTVLAMKSFYGGTQLHLEKDGAVAYTMSASLVQGKYALSCSIVNIHRFQQPLLVTVESVSSCKCLLDDDEYELNLSPPQVLPVQYTMGRWQRTTRIKVQLKPGDRVILTRVPLPPAVWGLTIKELFLEQM